jgi:aminopeptidase N
MCMSLICYNNNCVVCYQVNLDQFEKWYLQAGTPTVTATGSYNADSKMFTLTLKQVYTVSDIDMS